MKVGDIVTRKSHGHDVVFKIYKIEDENCTLKGLSYRLIVDAHINDLHLLSTRESNSECDTDSRDNEVKTMILNQDYNKSIEGGLPVYKQIGKILHIDGEKEYLDECLNQYEKLGISAIGISIKEEMQPKEILNLLKLYNPNILVITGHDSIVNQNKLSKNIYDYKNSVYYVESVKIAREYNKNYDDLVIIAGGCKSYYEEIMRAGANFASSPNRVIIHVIDPVLVAYKVATTSVKEFLNIEDVVKGTLSGISGIGGLETRGQCRSVKPKF